MRARHLVFRGLVFYWRTNLAMVLGVATAVAVLAGALLVGDSVRGSLRALMLDRIGRTDDVVVSPRFFTEALVSSVQSDAAFLQSFERVTPLVAARGVVTAQANGRRAGDVLVYGVDDRFWRFHRVARSGPRPREAFVSRALADQLGVAADATLLVRVPRVSDVPIETLHGRKEDAGRTLRVTAVAVLSREDLGEFSLEPAQRDVRAVFVPMAPLQEELETPQRVNTMLLSRRAGGAPAGTSLTQMIRRQATLADSGITVTPVPSASTLVVASNGGLLDDREANAARVGIGAAGLTSTPVFTYLANGLRVRDREVPYSLVSALDLETLGIHTPMDADAIVLNEWAASELRAGAGDSLTLDYYAWEEPGRLVTRNATFTVAGVVPIAAGGRDLAPTFPGITDSPTLDEWDPPFPLDLHRVRPVDEEYWNRYRTTPKAFIQIATGQRLWRSRYGELTSWRARVPEGGLDAAAARLTGTLRASIDPLASGMVVRDVRSAGLEASQGATDFGEYFVYFSFFLVVSALLLASLFFKLGVEQRVREVGLLRAVGFGPSAVRRLFLVEGLVLAVVGSVLGLAAALGYAALLMLGLRTWWVDAVGTTALVLRVTPMPLLAGAAGGVLAAVVCVWWTLRGLAHVTERSLLSGDVTGSSSRRDRAGRIPLVVSGLSALAGVALLVAGVSAALDATAAFFGGGVALMAAALGFFYWRLRQRPHRAVAEPGWWALSQLGIRYAGYRPGRSVLSAAVIACATFILIAVSAFRQDGMAHDGGRASSVGGYALIVDTLLPLAHDPNSREGQEALNLPPLGRDVRIASFRVLPGDDTSCLNLYQPKNPRIIAPPDAFLAESRFAFDRSLAETLEERANPWILLQRTFPDGAIPVIGDTNSMTYVLHKAVGDDILLPRGDAAVRLRLVAALHDSIFQGELVMASGNFVRLFPEVEGYQRWLVEAPANRVAALSNTIADALGDSGADVETTWGRLAQFHRVENTYLSTFQTLGALGLLLGTVGLGAVLMRNALERRRELALLGAVGYRHSQVLLLIVAENALLLAAGAGIGALAAMLAIAPALVERGGRVPVTAGAALLLFAVVATGLLSSLVAIRAATRGPLLASLRSE